MDYRVAAFVPAARHRAGLSSAGRHRVLAAALACLAVAATLGGIALSGSSVTAGGDMAAPGRPLPRWQPQPYVTSPDPIKVTTEPPRHAPGPSHRRAKLQARPAPLLALRSSSSVPARPMTARRRAVTVTYRITSQGTDGFQGEVQVTNNTGQPIGNWQIVVALDGDAVTSFSNAGGYVSNGILLLSPSSPAQVAPPHGGVLDVFFVAEGTQTAPAACAFNGIPCG
jgi:cellulose binding protein with CBM2 domain